MDPKYAEHYGELFEKHWWWRARAKLIVETLRGLRSSSRWGRILDVGCGDGLFFPQLREFGTVVEGIEPASQLGKNAGTNHIYVCPFDQNFRPPHKYSVILMLDVLEHLADPIGALRYARELLEPNGILLITVPAFMTLWTNHDLLNHHFTRYTKAGLRQLTESAELRITEARYFFYWMYAAKLLVRAVERISQSNPEVPHVPSGWINRSLYLVSRMEQKILGKLPIPIGSSLIAVLEHH